MGCFYLTEDKCRLRPLQRGCWGKARAGAMWVPTPSPRHKQACILHSLGACSSRMGSRVCR